MSVPKERSPESGQKEPETQEDDELGLQEPSKEEQGKGQTPKPVFNPLTLIKEDLNQIKEEVKKMFKEKDSDPKPSQSVERSSSPLAFLKDELSSVFRIGPSRDREKKDVAKKDDSRNNPRIKASGAERPDEPFKGLFRREKPLLKTAQTNPMKDSKTSKADLETNPTKRQKATEKTQKSISTTNGLTQSEVSQLTGCGSVRRTERTESLAPAPQSEMILVSKTGAAPDKSKTNLWQEVSLPAAEEKKNAPLEETLSSEISLIPLITDLSHEPTEDFWSLKNSAIYLTFEPNTANSEIRLADGNRKATRDWSTHRPADHPDRFERCPQVLCREGLLSLAYWEVTWSGGADIGVTYNNISRDGDPASCLLGHNERSWSLECSDGFYTPCHNKRRFQSSSPEPFTNRVGVYLDYLAGRLSFFCVSRDAMVHLHTFTSTFTEPLYPGFWVWASSGSVTLCQVELDWERLLK